MKNLFKCSALSRFFLFFLSLPSVWLSANPSASSGRSTFSGPTEFVFNHSRCGDFHLSKSTDFDAANSSIRARVLPSPSYNSVCRKNSIEFSTRYTEAKFFLESGSEAISSKRQYKKALDRFFFFELSRRALKKLQIEIGLLMGTGLGVPVAPALEAMDRLIRGNSQRYRRINQVLMRVFPDLRAEIIQDKEDPLGPLLCRVEYRQYKLRVFKKYSNMLIVPAVSLGIATITTASCGLVLPPLAITAGAVACVLGLRDILLAIESLPEKEKAGAFSKRLLKLYKKSERANGELYRDALKQGLSRQQTRAYIENAEHILGTMSQRKIELKSSIRAKNINRLLLVAGILNIGFNGFNLTGDPTLLFSIAKGLVPNQ